MTTIETLERELLYNSNDPVMVGMVPVYPVTIREIRRMGYARYKGLLGILCLTPEDISVLLDDPSSPGVPLYFLISILELKENQRDDILDAFRMVCHDTVTWDVQSMEIRLGDGVLNTENFPVFQTVIRERNKMLNKEVDSDDNPADERTKALLAKSRELEAKRSKARDGDDSGVTLADLVSICAAKLCVHPDAIGEYDMYQLNDVLGRFKMFEDYETNISALLHGAKKEDVDLRHWISGNQSLFD